MEVKEIVNAMNDIEDTLYHESMHPNIRIESKILAVKALWKQHPLKVIVKKLPDYPLLGKMATCPSCGIAFIESYGKSNYCGNCGQRISWE